MSPTRYLITNQTTRIKSHFEVKPSDRGGNAGALALSVFASPAARLARSLCAWLAGLGISAEVGLCAPGDRRWEFDTGQYVQYPVAIGQDGTVFVVSNPTGLPAMCTVWALDGATGQKKWEMPTGYVRSSPAVGLDGRIVFAAAWTFFPNPDARVVALDPASGAVTWEFMDAGSLEGNEGFPAIGQDGTVYFGSRVEIIKGVQSQHQVYAIHGANGAKMAAFDLPYANEWGPAIATDGTVYVGQANGAIVHARDGITMIEKWRNELERFGSLQGGPVIGPDGTIYIATPTSFYALNPATGAKKWDFTPPGSGLQYFTSRTPAIGESGTIIVASGQEIVALDPATGTRKWGSLQGSGGVKGAATSLAIAADGTVYFVDAYGVLFALDGETGAKKWDSGPKDGVYRSSTHPNVGSDGTVYFSTDKRVYAIVGTAPLANSSWPKFQADQFNSGRARLGGSSPPKFNTPTFVDGKVVISWEGEIKLFKGPTPDGPWEEILNPEKPFLALPSLDGEFFLLRKR